jgi:hypothetical protein
MKAQKPTIAKVNAMMPLSGSPQPLSFRIEINDKTSAVTQSSSITA